MFTSVDTRYIYDQVLNRIDGVMVSVLTSNAVDRGFEPLSGQTKDKQLVFVASPLSTQH